MAQWLSWLERRPVTAEVTGSSPVSYTHLDVYKRQNMSRVFMLKPADGPEGVKNAVLTAVKDAGPNACPVSYTHLDFPLFPQDAT